jgi:hypothetical protein
VYPTAKIAEKRIGKTRIHRTNSQSIALTSRAIATARNAPHTHRVKRAKTSHQLEFFAQFLAQSLEESRNSERTFQRFCEALRVYAHLFVNFPANISPHRRSIATGVHDLP